MLFIKFYNKVHILIIYNKAVWVRGWVWVGECGHRDGWEGVCDGKVWIKY